MSIFKPYHFYRKEAIEYRANQLLRQMQRRGAQYAPRWPFEASLVADFLDLGVVWERIPPDQDGAIAARILPLQRQIEINEEILDKPPGFQESTLAHEIGHWVLHINEDQTDGDLQDAIAPVEGETPPAAFVCRTSTDHPYLQSIEWQADYFASCLLMPRHILAQKRAGRDLTKWSHLYAMGEELGVSITNLVNRLQIDLGWIYVPKGSREIQPGPTFDTEQERMYG